MSRGNAALYAERVDGSVFALQHVEVVRGSRPVLHGVSLRLDAGEHMAILGPNGCGKSTLIKVLTCELYPVHQPGSSVRIFGRERWDVAELRQRLGVVSTELPGTPMLSTVGLDAVLTGFFGSSTLWPHLTVTPAMRTRAQSILQQVDAVELAGTPVAAMSTGQQRRIMIGRALAGSTAHPGSPAMLLLDEPCNGLDLLARRRLRSLLRELTRARVSLVLITHDVADIVPEIDRVVLMRDGRITADDDRNSLLTAESLSRLFATEVHVAQVDGLLHAW